MQRSVRFAVEKCSEKDLTCSMHCSPNSPYDAIMVKRKSEFDREDKKERARDVVRKVSKRIRFDDLAPIVEDGALLISKGSEVFFERIKESKPSTCVGVVVSLYGNGGVDVWDETNNEFFLFNWRKLEQSGVKVRMERSADEVPVQIASTRAQPFIHCTNEQIAEFIAMTKDDGYPHTFTPDAPAISTSLDISDDQKQQHPDVAECAVTIEDVNRELKDIEARLGERFGLRSNVRALLIEMDKAGQLVEDELVADWHDAMTMLKNLGVP